MNHGAFQNLLKRHRDRVFSQAFYFLRNREDAEDVTHNQCIDCHRRRSRIWNSVPADGNGRVEMHGVYLDSALNLEGEMEFSETQQELLAALEHLSPATRSLILMHYFQDLTFDRIAEITGMSTIAVKVAIHRGRKRLRGFLRKRIVDLMGERIISLQVKSFDIDSVFSEKIRPMMNRMELRLKDEKWDPIIRVQSRDQFTNVSIKYDRKQRMEGFFIMSLKPCSEASFVNIVGELDLENLAR